MLLGCSLMCAGSWLKVLSAAPDRFDIAFIGQTVIGVAQMFTLGVPGRLAAVWFGAKEVSFACAVGVFGNQVGSRPQAPLVTRCSLCTRPLTLETVPARDRPGLPHPPRPGGGPRGPGEGDGRLEAAVLRVRGRAHRRPGAAACV